jgi:SAM-dependent methyltransferase
MSTSLDPKTSRFIHDSRDFKSLRDQILDCPFFGQAVRFGFSTLESVKNSTIIDMGCGGGTVSVFFALHGAQVIGLDKQQVPLKRAKGLALQWGVQDRCTFIQCYSEQMAIGTETVDIIFSRSTLQYMDRERALDECMRIIRPSGTLILNEDLPYNPFLGIYRLQRKLRAKSPEDIAYVNSIRGYLTFRDIHKLQGKFSTLIHNEYHLFRMFTLVLCQRFRHTPWIGVLDEKVAKLDGFILAHFPFSRRFAWFVAVVGKDKKDSFRAFSIKQTKDT